MRAQNAPVVLLALLTAGALWIGVASAEDHQVYDVLTPHGSVVQCTWEFDEVPSWQLDQWYAETEAYIAMMGWDAAIIGDASQTLT